MSVQGSFATGANQHQVRPCPLRPESDRQPFPSHMSLWARKRHCDDRTFDDRAFDAIFCEFTRNRQDVIALTERFVLVQCSPWDPLQRKLGRPLLGSKARRGPYAAGVYVLLYLSTSLLAN